MEDVEITIAFSECLCLCCVCVCARARALSRVLHAKGIAGNSPHDNFLQMKCANYIQHEVIIFENTNFKISLFV